MTTIHWMFTALIVTTLSLSSSAQSEELDKQAREPDQKADLANPLTAEIRRQMLEKEAINNDSGSQRTFPKFYFRKFADEHGLAATRKALVPLLTDPTIEIREQAAQAADEWITFNEIGDDVLRTMLADHSLSVRKIALKYVCDSSVDPETVFIHVRNQNSDLREQAVQLLPVFARKGNETAEELLINEIRNENAQLSADAMLLIADMGVNGRFAESSLRQALSDVRTYVEDDGFCSMSRFQHENKYAAVVALSRIGFMEDATATKLRELCKTASEKYSVVRNINDLSVETWVEAAITLAEHLQDFMPARDAINLRAGELNSLAITDARTIARLLDIAPRTITDWEDGLRVCRGLLDTPEKRNYATNWSALEKYPNAAIVFEPEMQQLLHEEIARKSSADYPPAASVISMRATDGFSHEDLDFSLRLIGVQRKTDDGYDVEWAQEELVRSMKNEFMENTTELIMLDLLNSKSVNPERFRELLKLLPLRGEKSKARIRLETVLDLAEEGSYGQHEPAR